MNPWLRFARFNAVGAAGVGVQLATVWLLTGVAQVHYLPATSAAVGVAVVHNFAWHRRWTWGDREASAGPVALFMRFAAANGAVSLAGNLAAMAVLVPLAHMTPVAANAVAIAVTGVLNFRMGDVVVFRRGRDQVVRAAGAGADSSRWNCRRW